MSAAKPVPVPEGARELFQAINASTATLWDTLRAFNAKTGASIDALTTEHDTRAAMVEELRRRYFPRASRLVITDEGALTVSPTARSIRKVWPA